MFRKLALLFCGFLLCFGFGITPSAGSSGMEYEYTYLSPQPGARHISPGTSIAVRTSEPFRAGSLDPRLFSVEGTASGKHSGTLRLSDDNFTLLFYPDQVFAYGEIVQVKILPGLRTVSGKALTGASFTFSTIDRPYDQFPALSSEVEQTDQPAAPALAAGAPPYRTYPEFDNMMSYSVSVPASGTASGLVFFTSSFGGTGYTPGLFVVDDAGDAVFLQKETTGLNVTDFKVQTAGGVPYLTYHIGTPAGAWSYGSFYRLDQSYGLVDTWTIGNGYGADEHEMQLLDNGHVLLLGYSPIPYDLSPFGGPVDGTLVDAIIQEQDSDQNVVFEWHASQHLPIENTYGFLSRSPSDYFHTNAIELDSDGNLLISSRHLSEITKIDRDNGDVIWRLGGPGNQFTFLNDQDHFSYQHDIRRLPNQHITIFDNGNLRTPTHYSRAIEYIIDEDAKTIVSVWEYPGDDSLYAPFMGNAQRLPNGNTMIGWGALPQITEVDASGNPVFGLSLGGLTYRAFRSPWNASPAESPRLALDPSTDLTTATLYFAWNGATQIDSYDIYAGATLDTLNVVKNVAKTGFETSAVVEGLPADTCVFKVKPVHHLGDKMPFSNAVYQLARHECAFALPYQYRLPRVFRMAGEN